MIELGKTDTVTTETLFQAASITKSLTATTIMKKIEEGKLSLTDDVNTYLTSWKIPDYKQYRINLKQYRINLKQLMSHTSGIMIGNFPPYTIYDTLPSILQVLTGAAPARNAAVMVSYTKHYIIFLSLHFCN